MNHRKIASIIASARKILLPTVVQSQRSRLDKCLIHKTGLGMTFQTRIIASARVILLPTVSSKQTRAVSVEPIMDRMIIERAQVSAVSLRKLVNLVIETTT